MNFVANLESSQGIANSETKELIFLNYVPQYHEFQVQQQEKINLVNQLEKDFESQSQQIIDEFFRYDSEKFNIIPKKSNIDLKRHLQSKFDKLNKRNEYAIVQLLRQKMNLDPLDKDQNMEHEAEADTEPEIFEETKLFNREMKYDSQLISQQKNYLDQEMDYSNLVKQLGIQDRIYENLGDNDSLSDE